MKKLLLLLLFVTFSAFSQGTTQKEYNYLSKGYKDDVAMGKDIIQGYTLVLLQKALSTTKETNKSIERTTELHKMLRSDNSIAGFLLIEKRIDTGYENYFCIPNPSSDTDIWTQAQNAYIKRSEEYKCDNVGAVFSYNWNLLRMLSFLQSK